MNARVVAVHSYAGMLKLRRILLLADDPVKPWRRRICHGDTLGFARGATHGKTSTGDPARAADCLAHWAIQTKIAREKGKEGS